MSHLFTPYEIRGVTLKNRIVMSPMCMYASDKKDGKVTDWHRIHYTSRAVGQVGLIILEATAVLPEGRISDQDLGIWSDDHIAGLKELVNLAHQNGSKMGIQLAHAGRKSNVEGTIFAPSALPFDEKHRTPEALDAVGIQRVVNAFRDAAIRAKQAGFDVIELHGAHGYLINEFLSPLSNKREDAFGGSPENRYRFLGNTIDEVRKVWEGPLFVRISASDYHSEGLGIQDYITYSAQMREQGVDLVDCSSGAIVSAPIDIFPGYQVPFAEAIRREAGIATGAVGLINSPLHAEEIVHNGRADLVFLGRALLSNPYWPRTAAKELNTPIEAPKPYGRGW